MYFGMLTISQYLILAAAFFFAGIVDAAAGGGGLFTVPTFLLIGFPIHMVSGTNQSSIVFGSVTASLRYLKKGLVDIKAAILIGIVSILGSFLGVQLNIYLPEKFLQLTMIALLPMVAIVFFLTQKDTKEDKSNGKDPVISKTASSILLGLVIGAYTGFYGAASATLMMLALMYLQKLDIVTASGTAKLSGLFATVTATITYALSGKVFWPVVITAMACNIAGNYIGAGLAIKNGARFIRPLIIMVLTLLFGRLIYTVAF